MTLKLVSTPKPKGLVLVALEDRRESHGIVVQMFGKISLAICRERFAYFLMLVER